MMNASIGPPDSFQGLSVRTQWVKQMSAFPLRKAPYHPPKGDTPKKETANGTGATAIATINAKRGAE